MIAGRCEANGLRLAFEVAGSPDDPTLLLVAGRGAPGSWWADQLCARLVAGGRQVVRFDNRDAGQTTWLGDPPEGYDVVDMALDALAVLDHLGVPAAHVVGASMGGVIAQVLALDHPTRVRTLTSVMASPGGAGLEGPSPELLSLVRAADSAPASDRAAAALRVRRALAGGGFPEDDPFRQAQAEHVAQRFDASGLARQSRAMVGAPARRERLAGLVPPALIVHGSADPLVPLSSGLATSSAIPGSSSLVIDGMGHELPPSAWDTFAEAVLAHTAGTQSHQMFGTERLA